MFRASKGLKNLAMVWLFLLFSAGVANYFETKKELATLEFTRWKQSQEMVRLANDKAAIEASRIASSEYSTAIEHMRNYQKWLDHQEYKNVVEAFKHDEPIFMKGNSAIRKDLSQASYFAALAYRGLGQNKKSAYYYALAAKVLAETYPHEAVLRTYIDQAKALDPSSPYVRQVERGGAGARSD